ncbi:MAG: hypothetical protein ACHQ1D_03420 [Nitrososphaerales archaeon]
MSPLIREMKNPSSATIDYYQDSSGYAAVNDKQNRYHDFTE